MNKIMRRCSNFSYKLGSVVCCLLSVEHQLPQGPMWTMEGLATLWVVSDTCGDVCREGTLSSQAH